MNLWRTRAIAILKSFLAFVLVLFLTSCGEKAVSQQPFGSLLQNPQQNSTKQISEVSPPAAIQELRQLLEVYQPQIAIVTPKQDEILQDNTVTVNLEVKDLPIFKDSQLDLGPHLKLILDNQPYLSIYDLNQPIILPDLSPGTHTLRVFAAQPWDESFKNEGAYVKTTFHIFTKTDDNNPDQTQPLLTYNSPQGKYGAEPVLLDFYLTNAPLHLVAQENPKDEIADWRIRCTINGDSFVLDRWEPVYLKGFKPGKNWVKIEFLDEQGNPVKNVFNTTVRLITYEPKGKDTLSRIVRGELSADQVRTILDPNYPAQIPVPEPTPAPEPTPEAQKIPPTEPTPTPEPTPEVETTPPTEPTPTGETTPEIEKIPSTEPTPTGETTPEIEKIPSTEPTSTPEAQKIPSTEPTPTLEPTPESQKTPPTQPISTPESTPSLPSTLPEIVIESPEPKTTAEPLPGEAVIPNTGEQTENVQ